MKTIVLDDITLRYGKHESRDEGVCWAEAVAWFAGEPHSDRPKCMCAVIAAMGRGLNDAMRSDAERVGLLQYVPKVVGTAGDGHAERRAWMAADWLIRTNLPRWMDATGLDGGAALRALPEIRSEADVQRARPLIDAAESAAWSIPASWSAAEAALFAAWSAGYARSARSASWSAAEAAAGCARVLEGSAAAVEEIAAELRRDAVRLFAEMIAIGSEDRPLYSCDFRTIELTA